MARICCLAGIDPPDLPRLRAILKRAGETSRAVTVALDVRSVGPVRPNLLIGDFDPCAVDALELLRQIRFVLPSCVIAVFSADLHQAWGLACHLAGANCLLSKSSSNAELAAGLAGAVESGCFTDPRIVA